MAKESQSLSRVDAALLIERIMVLAERHLLVREDALGEDIRKVVKEAGLTLPTPCHHEAGFYQDNCFSCAPHWQHKVIPIKIK